MRRFLARSVAILCLLLYVTCSVVWLRSWWVEDRASFADADGRQYSVYSLAGALHLEVVDANDWDR